MENGNVKSRCKEFARAKGIPVYKFEEMCGMSQGYVSNIRQSISPAFLQKMTSVFPDLNVTWLLTGNGDMYVSVGDVTDYGTNTGQIRDDKQTAHDNNAPVFQNTGRGGNNVTQGAPASTIDSLIAEMRAQREASEKQIDRLLTIIENMQK